MADFDSLDHVERLSARLDELMTRVTGIAETVARIDARCEPCRKLVESHEAIIHGDGRDGLLVRLAAAEHGRVDTLSVRAICTLMTAMGTLAAAIGASVASLIR